MVVDSRRQQPAPALLSSMSELQVSQARKICNYPPTHTHRGFSGPAKSPLSSEPPNSMFLPVYYTVAFLAPLLLFDQPALLTQIGFFSKGSPFEFAVSAALRHVPEKKGWPQGSCGEACAYLSVFNHTLGAGLTSVDFQEAYHHAVMMSLSAV